MSGPDVTRALILTYHAVERGPAPLCVPPELFEAHAAVVRDSGLPVLTVRELAETLRTGALRGAVAITFDDGFSSVVEQAAPVLAALGLPATVFAAAGHVGGENDWPSAHEGSYRSPLASASALAELASAGFEIGSHGTAHEPLAGAPDDVLRRELVASRRALEDAVGVPVSSYAYPYGALPGAEGRALVEQTYDAACSTSLGRVSSTADVYRLPRVDAHYVRSPERLRRALEGRLDGYLWTRSLAARARRTVLKDYAASRATGRPSG